MFSSFRYFTDKSLSLILRDPAFCCAMSRTVDLSACVGTEPLSWTSFSVTTTFTLLLERLGSLRSAR